MQLKDTICRPQLTRIGCIPCLHTQKNGQYQNKQTKAHCEIFIEKCKEHDIIESSYPDILSSILDEICRGHHGGYHIGQGLGWPGKRKSNIAMDFQPGKICKLQKELETTKNQFEEERSNLLKRIERLEAFLVANETSSQSNERVTSGASRTRQIQLSSGKVANATLTERDVFRSLLLIFE